MGSMRAALTYVRDLLMPPRALPLRLEPLTRTFSAGPVDDVVASAMIAAAGAASGPVARTEALTVAAVQRARNELAAVATLPLVLYRDATRIKSPFLAQIDPDVANVVTLAQTIEDLLCDGVAWWRIIGQDWRNFPTSARRVDPATVSLDPPDGASPANLPGGYDPRGASVWIDGERVDASAVIRFDSPNPALLIAGARSIRRALLLDRLAGTYADNPRPLDVFTASRDTSVVLPDDLDDEADQFLSQWRVDRKRAASAWIPEWAERVDVASPSPSDLQLVQLQQQVTLEIANATGVDPEDLGVSTTSRTYQNEDARRRDKINRVYSPYMLAITQRLSMGDVTPGTQRVAFDLTDYLKPDPTGRVAYYQGMRDLVGVTAEWIAAQEGITPDAIGPAPAAAAPAGAAGANVVPLRRAGSFAGDRPRHTFAVPTGGPRTFSVDPATRTIAGLAVPYNVRTRKNGMWIEFAPGSLEWTSVERVKHFEDHQRAVGKALNLTSEADGLAAVLDVQPGPDGDALLSKALHGTYDGMSVGIDYDEDPAAGDITFDEESNTLVIHRADLREISTTAMPAFDSARITRVTASRTGGTMDCQHCGRAHAPGVSCVTAARGPAPVATFTNPTPAPQPIPAPGDPLPGSPAPVPSPAPHGAIDPSRVAAAFALLGISAPGAGIHPAPADDTARTFVDPTRRSVPAAQVTEPEPYRVTFSTDRAGIVAPVLQRGSHDFSSDLHAFFVEGDVSAHRRAMSWVQRQFDVTTGNVDELNPTRVLAGRYVDQRQYRFPVWSAISKGTLGDITPFSWPKFNSAAGLTGPHTEGIEPTSGSFTTTSQTVTPAATSGKVKISRETWDQGGNPQLSTLLWQKMTQSWYEGLEAFAVALLNAATPTQLNTFTAGGGTGFRTLVTQLEQGLVQLQFARGGYTFTDGFAQADFFEHVAGATDTTERKLYPMRNPTNAQGQAATRYASIDVAGTEFVPSWALAARGQTAATSSYVIDRGSVDGWASTPQRLTIDMTEVANVYLGIWGYHAEAINDLAGVREITYDPVA